MGVFVGILTCPAGHGVEQVPVAHGRSPWKNGKTGNTQGHRPPTQRAGGRKNPRSARGADEDNERAARRDGQGRLDGGGAGRDVRSAVQGGSSAGRS